MPSDDWWGYAQHELSVADITDADRWRSEEHWAIENALEYARLEQQPATARAAAGRGFMACFEAMVDANLHRPLELSTDSELGTDSDDATEQATLTEVKHVE